MLDKKELKRIRRALAEADNLREEVIALSRFVLRKSKKVIYAVHRHALQDAEKFLSDVASDKKKLDNLVKSHPELFSLNIYNIAMQEYAEAATYLSFVKEKSIPTAKELRVSLENYLLGLCDLTGELGRRAVFATIEERYEHVQEIQSLVDEIYGAFLDFNLRNSELRRKADAIKWNLKKIEEVLYDNKIRGKL